MVSPAADMIVSSSKAPSSGAVAQLKFRAPAGRQFRPYDRPNACQVPKTRAKDRQPQARSQREEVMNKTRDAMRLTLGCSIALGLAGLVALVALPVGAQPSGGIPGVVAPGAAAE